MKYKYCERDIGEMIKSVLFLDESHLQKFNSRKLEDIFVFFFLWHIYFYLKVIRKETGNCYLLRTSLVRLMIHRDNYLRLSRMSGRFTLQNPVATNKQVIKLGVHLLLRAGNKVVKLRDTPAATYIHIMPVVSAIMLAEKRISFPSSSLVAR